MRLLVTNPWNGQAYCLVRDLRPHASRLVVTAYREHGLLGRLAPGAVSRFVDRVYTVPLAVSDWRRGDGREQNSDPEERYIRAILEICERERLDTVFPSWDPEVFVLSRNKSRFTERAITVPVPKWSSLRRTMDKYSLIEAATAVGFPCPKTSLPATRAEARELAEQLGFPLVVKPRFSAGARGTHLVTDPPQLAAVLEQVEPSFGMPILQEWIPGGQDRRVSVSLTLDRQGQLVSAQIRRILRSVFPSFSSVPAAQVSWERPDWTADAARLVRSLGYWGHARVQLKVDPRDGLGKLLEINCRPGFLVWCEIAAGQDVPLLCVRIERGEPVEMTPSPPGVRVFLSPIEDTISLCAVLLERAGRRIWPTRWAPPAGDPPLREVLKEYRATYRAPRRILDWYFRALADDPLAGLAWYGAQLTHIAREPKRLPFERHAGLVGSPAASHSG